MIGIDNFFIKIANVSLKGLSAISYLSQAEKIFISTSPVTFRLYSLHSSLSLTYSKCLVLSSTDILGFSIEIAAVFPQII